MLKTVSIFHHIRSAPVNIVTSTNNRIKTVSISDHIKSKISDNGNKAITQKCINFSTPTKGES
jgi:hypothetical protein